MVSIEPLCSSPSSSPAPRISRSCVASAKPAPRSSSEAIASRRFCASVVIAFGCGVSSHAYAWWWERPTRPRNWCNCARPKWSARSMIMVLAVGMSIPVSIMVVQTSTLKRWWWKSFITRSSSRSRICPWPMAIRASGTSSASRSAAFWMFSTSL